MTYKLTWLPGVLKDGGLKVAEVPGWESRGRAEMGDPVGVICHHTAGGPTGNMPSLQTLVKGTSKLGGPLAQLGLGRDGTYYVVAAGRCNHAGTGKWMDETDGNSRFIGIEAENTGQAADRWPEVQMDAYQRGAAAILRHLRSSAAYCAGHKEYALPAGRKPDPLFDMHEFRREVDAILSGRATAPVLIPGETPDPNPLAGPRPTLRRSSLGKFVRLAQAKVQVAPDGFFGPQTEAAVRVFQRTNNLVPDGIVGPKTWSAFDQIQLGAQP